MPDVVLPASKTKINRAGDLMRDWHDAGRPPGQEEQVERARGLIAEFRAVFQRPMTSVNMGLRSYIRTCLGIDAMLVAQRLKRREQIELKLARFPDTKLARMEDIGGVRAVLTGQNQVFRVWDHMTRLARRSPWEIHRVRDYFSTPKPSGYRAVHLILRRDGCLIEVQLRTELQHDWAEFVETAGRRTGYQLKEDQGPVEIREWLKHVADMMAIDDADYDMPVSMNTRLDELRQRARPFLRLKEER